MGPHVNEIAGWVLIGLGFATGGLMGLFFLRPGWLGGYDDPRRRLVRLGHIALVMLGVLNVLFALSAPRLGWEAWLVPTASWLWLVGAILMPSVCALSAWRRSLKHLFALPVLALGAGVTLTWLGLIAGRLAQGGA